jgi:hypothetical protein
MIGVGIGTSSSIYVAATVMLAMNVDRENLIEPEEGELVDDLPDIKYYEGKDIYNFLLIHSKQIKKVIWYSLCKKVYYLYLKIMI